MECGESSEKVVGALYDRCGDDDSAVYVRGRRKVNAKEIGNRKVGERRFERLQCLKVADNLCRLIEGSFLCKYGKGMREGKGMAWHRRVIQRNICSKRNEYPEALQRYDGH